MAGRRHTANRRIAPPSPNCLKSKGAPRVGESFGDVPPKRRTDDANHLRRLGIQGHKAPSEQRLFPEIINGVRPQRGDEDFARGQAVLMIAINLDPVFLGDIPQNHIDRGMVVLDSGTHVPCLTPPVKLSHTNPNRASGTAPKGVELKYHFALIDTRRPGS